MCSELSVFKIYCFSFDVICSIFVYWKKIIVSSNTAYFKVKPSAVLTHNQLKNKSIDEVINLSGGFCLYLIKERCLASAVIGHRRRQNVVATSVTHSDITDVRRVGTFTARDDFECTLECLRNPLCRSLNIAASRRTDEKIWCELLFSDKHGNAKVYKENTSSHHLSNMVRFPAIFSLTFKFSWL